jgi:circadian clock protein KaiB
MKNILSDGPKLNASQETPEYTLRLFITGATTNSIRAVSNIQRICESHLHGKYILEIVDLYDQKYIAEQEQIVAVPMLIKESPLPMRKLIGDLSNSSKVLEILGLNV